MRRSILMQAFTIGTVLQVAMVIAGHWIPFIRVSVFAIGGTAISVLAAMIYARNSAAPRSRSAANGAVVGGSCGLIGIAVSYALGDVPANILLLGTLSSTVASAIAAALSARRPA